MFTKNSRRVYGEMAAGAGAARYNKNNIRRVCFRQRRQRVVCARRLHLSYEEDCVMLPCRESCPDYQAGCHKQCRRWREYQQHQQIQRAQKTAYLRFYRELCGTITRQLRANTARYPMW